MTESDEGQERDRKLTDGECDELKRLFCNLDIVDAGVIHRFEDLRSRASSADYLVLVDDPDIARAMVGEKQHLTKQRRRLPAQDDVTLACLIGMAMGTALFLGVWP